jgi:small subunit ribosomal protein S5
MGLVTPRKSARELFKPYTEEEKKALAKKYTPAQMEVVEAGEKVVTPEDLDMRGVIRTDIGALGYLDDLSIVHGVVDKRPEVDEPIDPKVRLMTEDEYGDAIGAYMKQFEGLNEGLDKGDPNYHKKSRPNRRDVLASIAETPKFMGSNGPVRGQTLTAPGVPKFIAGTDDGLAKKKEVEEEADERDPDGIYDQLRKQTGYTLDEILDFKVKILVMHRVVNQTRLGKVQSMYILAIAGNGQGRLGLGQAKGQELENTMNLARIAAIRNMQPVPRYEDRTIFGEVEAKVSAVEVKLMARPPGKTWPL